jgi:hypothetical protein
VSNFRRTIQTVRKDGRGGEREARSDPGGQAVPRTYAAASRGLAGQVRAPSTSVNRGRAGNTTTEELTFT